MSTRTLAPNQVRKRGMEALTRDLGVAGMVQFMQQFSSGAGDYSRERHQIVGSLSVDNIWSEIKKTSRPKR